MASAVCIGVPVGEIDLDSPESIEFNYVCYMDQLGRVSGNWLSTYSCGRNRISTLSKN